MKWFVQSFTHLHFSSFVNIRWSLLDLGSFPKPTSFLSPVGLKKKLCFYLQIGLYFWGKVVLLGFCFNYHSISPTKLVSVLLWAFVKFFLQPHEPAHLATLGNGKKTEKCWICDVLGVNNGTCQSKSGPMCCMYLARNLVSPRLFWLMSECFGWGSFCPFPKTTTPAPVRQYCCAKNLSKSYW